MSDDRDIRKSTISGLGWTGSSQLLQQAAQFVFTAVLAHLLTPHEFGLIALVVVFSGFAAVFVDFGLTAGVIQRPDLRARHLNTAFWMNLASGVVFMLGMMALAPALAVFYDQPRLVAITIALAPVFVLSAIGMVQMAMLQREMDFRRIALIELATLVASNAVAVALAVTGFGVWSLVALSLGTTGFRSAFAWGSTRWHPSPHFDRESMRELWGFSSRVAAFNGLNYWARNADNLLIGRFVGTVQLAYYNRAYNLMLLPILLVASVTSRVMFPALSRIQENREQVKRVYLKALGLIAFATFPAMLGLLAVADPFVLTVYGHQWEEVVPILQILCIPSMLQCLTRTTGWIFQSQGRSDWMLRWGVIATLTVIASFFIGLPWGVKGVAVAYACWSGLMVVPIFAIVGRLIGVTVRDVGAAIAGVTVASAAMAAVVWLVEFRLPHELGAPSRLAIGVVTGAVAYLAALALVSPKPYEDFRDLVREYTRRRGGLRVASS